MENTQVSSDTKLKSFPYLHYRSDNFRFHVSKPIWLLGFGFHGPHTPSNVNLHNLKIHIEVLDEDSSSDHRHLKLLAKLVGYNSNSVVLKLLNTSKMRES